MDCVEKLRNCFDEMVVYKDLKKTNFFSALSLPSFMRDWLLKKFEDDEGYFDKDDLARFVKKYIPRKDDWTSIKNRIIIEGEKVKFLAKISIDINVRTGEVSFALPDFGLGYKDTIIESDVWDAHGALIHTDAVQAVGHIPIDVNALGVDLLSASAHKFNGPKGIGFLYIRRGTSIHPFADGGAQEFGMRAGTENVAAIVGMSVALKKNCDHMVEIGARLHKLEQVFLGTLQQAGIDFVRNGSENRVPGNISISIRGASGEMLLHRLDLKGIAISTGSACDSVNPQVSHVIQAIGVPNEYAEGTIRVSFGRDNQVEEARDVANAIICILNSKL